MTTNKELQKEYAVKAMRTLRIYGPYVNAFKAKRQRVCEFADFGGFYVDEDSALYEDIKAVEERTGCMVYAVLRNRFDGMDLVSYLLISDAQDEMARCVGRYDGSTFIALAWVENQTCRDYSEMGTIGVQSFGGGIRRVW